MLMTKITLHFCASGINWKSSKMNSHFGKFAVCKYVVFILLGNLALRLKEIHAQFS